eukprot:IDg18734t1
MRSTEPFGACPLPHRVTTRFWSGCRRWGSRGRSLLLSRAHLVVFARHEFLGGLNSDGCIAAIGICANGFAKLFVQRRTTDQNGIVVADALSDHRINDDLHVWHCGRQQSGHSQNVGLLGLKGFEIGLYGVVDPK